MVSPMDLLGPHSHDEGAGEPSLRPVAAHTTRTDRTVFVIDSDHQTRRSLELCLQPPGSPALEFFPHFTAFLLRRRSRGSDCVLFDPISANGGIDMLEAVCSSYPVIVMTRTPTLTLAVRALQAGVVDLLEKPLRRDRVLASLTRALQSRHCSPPSVAREDTENWDRFRVLSPRQRQVLDLVMAGLPNKLIAANLALSQRTVENHRAAIMRKFGCKSLAGLVKKVCAHTHVAHGDD